MSNEPGLQRLVLPTGTQIVTRVEIRDAAGQRVCPHGAVAVVVESPVSDDALYRVRFLNGHEAVLRREDLSIRKHVQRAGLGGVLPAPDRSRLHDYVIYRCVVGSRAYGLEGAESDTDRRGIYLPPAEVHWSLAGAPEQLENDETQEVYWEIQKFLTLALKANPNVLECLYTPLVELATPLAQELLDMRSIFLSRLIYQTYNGYVTSQFKKLEQDLRTRGSLKWKHVMHLIRLLLSGITVLREGFVPVRVDEYRDQLLAIRRGEVPWDEVNAWRLALHREFDDAYGSTRLPEYPDFDRANAFLIEARRSAVDGKEVTDGD